MFYCCSWWADENETKSWKDNGTLVAWPERSWQRPSVFRPCSPTERNQASEIAIGPVENAGPSSQGGVKRCQTAPIHKTFTRWYVIVIFLLFLYYDMGNKSLLNLRSHVSLLLHLVNILSSKMLRNDNIMTMVWLTTWLKLLVLKQNNICGSKL